MQILDHGLEFAGVTASDAAAEDQGEFVGLTNAAIGVEEPLLKSIDGSATTEDQIVTEFYLCEKQSVLNPGVLSLLGGEKGSEAGQPFLCTGDQIVGREGIRSEEQTSELQSPVHLVCRLLLEEKNIVSFRNKQLYVVEA